jgi:hypothetical protein
MKNKAKVLMLSLAICLISCTKENQSSKTQWNALSFTEFAIDNYTLYMDLPHLNLTFPSEFNGNKIKCVDGLWKDGPYIYTIVSHNWTEGKINLKLIKAETVEKQYQITPGNSIDLEMELSPGEYRFEAEVIDSRGVTLLNVYPLHGTKNKMVVK